MSQNHMFSVKDVAYNAMLAALLFVIFLFFSQILYVEFVTVTVILYGLTFKPKNAITITIIFAALVCLVYGIQPWSIMYFIIWPLYTYLTGLLKTKLVSIPILTAWGFLLSLLAGNLIDIPYFLLFNKEVTIAYLLLGLKTTFVSASITAVFILLVFEPIYKLVSRHKMEEL